MTNEKVADGGSLSLAWILQPLLVLVSGQSVSPTVKRCKQDKGPGRQPLRIIVSGQVEWNSGLWLNQLLTYPTLEKKKKRCKSCRLEKKEGEREGRDGYAR